MNEVGNYKWLPGLLLIAISVSMCDSDPVWNEPASYRARRTYSEDRSDKLMYRPPNTTCTKVISQTWGDQAPPPLDNNCDWRVVLPNTPMTGKLKIRGGRNIVIIGGAWKMEPNQGNVALAFYDDNNTSPRIIHVEGVDFDMDDAEEVKGMVFEAPTAHMRFQNIRITGLHSDYYGNHADGIKNYGALSLRIHKMTVTTDYQGFWLGAGDSAGIRGIRSLGLVNLKEVEFARANLIENHPIFLMLTDTMNTCTTFPNGAWFTDVFIVQDGPVFGDKEVYPTLSLPPSCPAEPTGDGTRLYWPAIPDIQGHVEKVDSLRPIVPEGVPGIDYRSPGYLYRY